LKTLVTGGTGFIGSHTVKALEAVGHEAVVFDLPSADVRNPDQVLSAMAACDAWIHLAGLLGTAETCNDPIRTVQTNLVGTLNMLEAADRHKRPGVVISTGNHFMDNPYSITKSAGERFVRMFNTERGTQISVVRARDAYGAGQAIPGPWGSALVRKVIPTFVCGALRGEDLQIYGDGEQVVDMVHVTDVARCLVATAETTEVHGPIAHTLDVGTGTPTTVNDLAKMVIEMTKADVGTRHVPMRSGEAPGRYPPADTSTLGPIGVTADDMMPLSLGLPLTVEWYQYALEPT